MSDEKITVHRYEVDICDPCVKLQGQMCHTPGCIFCRHEIKDISAGLDLMMIRPIIDGAHIENLQSDAVIVSGEPSK